MNNMDILNYLNVFFISILYFWGSSTALFFGIGFYTLYRPVISGMIVGLILGDMNLGMLAGSVVNIIYIDFVSTGGSLKGDQCLTAIIAAVSAVLFKLSPIEAAAFSYPFGFLGILIWKYRLNINSIFVKKYDEKYKEGKNPNITIYNGVFPQLLLYIMSTAVIIISLFAILLFKDILKYEAIKNILFWVGIYLLSISSVNVLANIKNKIGVVIFILALISILIFNVSSLLIVTVLMTFFIVLSINDLKEKSNIKQNNESKILNKRDLFYSWFIWMNFSHGCYNFERLQGMAFAHSMKNIIKKLYKNEKESSQIIKNHTEFFNTEPNMGTPIHGYIISLEEQKSMGGEIHDVSYMKKGMMGIAAGLGDSFTQVVLTPFFISMAILLCFDKNYFFAAFSVILLGIVILSISYTGWMNGYYLGRESLMKRLNIVKNSKIKKYFPLVFDGILGACVGKLMIINKSVLYGNLFIFILVLLLSFVYLIIAKNKGKIIRRS